MNRYARQTVLPEVGQEGQEKLKTTSVLCVGAGGLGSPALLYLAAAGIGRIGLVDDDITDISNLQRQVLFREENQGAPKVKAAAVALASLNSECSIEPYHERLTAINAERLVTGYDIIIDGTDNFGSKFLINDACVKYGKPLVYGSILGFEAQVSLFWAVHGPCYRCLYSKPPSNHIPNCAEAGVIGAMAGIAGTVQALEAIKIALGLTWCKEKKLPITSITPFTFQDYPGHTACILWFSGCNMACGYCHNPELVKGELAKFPFEKMTTFLESRKGLLDGVVLSGGECTISPSLPEFAAWLRTLGYHIKIDTNGTNPDMLEKLLTNGLVDFIALDFKAPREKFTAITGSHQYDQFERSLFLLCRSEVSLEIRTTVHADQLDEEDINSMMSVLSNHGFSGRYYLQRFKQGFTLGNLGAPCRAFDPSALIKPPFTLELRNFS